MSQKGFTPIFIVTLIAAVATVGYLLYQKQTLQALNLPLVNTNKEPPVSEDIKNTYFPIWKELFMQQNNISEDYISKHIKIVNIYKHDWDFGESLSIRYQFIIDWATVPWITDSILIKPKNLDKYYSPEEVIQNAKIQDIGDILYKISRVIPVESIVSYDTAIKNLKTQCSPLLKSARDNVEIDDWIKSPDYGQIYLTASGVVNEKKNQCKRGRVRLYDGKITICSDTPCVSTQD